MKVLVTGAAGFIGSHVMDRLMARGDDVVGMDNFNPYYSPELKRSNVTKECLVGDVRHDMYWIAQEYKPDVIVHLAATPGVRQSMNRCREYLNNNLRGTQELLDCAVMCGVNHVVFASTSSVYGHAESPFCEDMPCDRPLAPYPASKRMAEMLGHSYHNIHGLNFTALRFFSVYGPRARPDMMPYLTCEAIATGRPLTLFNKGQMWRDWTHVDDIVSGVVAAVDRPMGYEVINLGNGNPVRMDHFVGCIEAEMGRPVMLELKNAPASEPVRTCANISKARDLLGYNPTTSIEQGIPTLCWWYNSCCRS